MTTPIDEAYDRSPLASVDPAPRGRGRTRRRSTQDALFTGLNLVVFLTLMLCVAVAAVLFSLGY